MEAGLVVIEPRHAIDYSERQVKAARRVLIDVGQVLADFRDAFVVIGGWVPDLLLPEAEEPHVGSIDVDLALNAEKLSDGRYAELLTLLLDTRRYALGEKAFQLVTNVDLADGGSAVRVELEFLAPKEMRLDKNRPKLIAGFRVLQVEACGAAFVDPKAIEISGPMMSGAANTVRVQVASLPDFAILKALAIGGREKPKDSYDLCYCLDEGPRGEERESKRSISTPPAPSIRGQPDGRNSSSGGDECSWMERDAAARNPDVQLLGGGAHVVGHPRLAVVHSARAGIASAGLRHVAA